MGWRAGQRGNGSSAASAPIRVICARGQSLAGERKGFIVAGVDSLTPHEAFCLRAAEGWLELNNPAEAKAELSQISPEFQGHPDVLSLRWHICQRAKAWEDCLVLARQLTESSPNDPRGWIALAQTHYYGQQYEVAYDLAVSKITTFPRHWPLYYDSACYACLTGRLDQAKQFLQLAMAFGDADSVRSRAVEDPDLATLWKEAGEAESEG